jgi:hypothetical protein
MARALSDSYASRQFIAPRGLIVNTGPIERDVPMAIQLSD